MHADAEEVRRDFGAAAAGFDELVASLTEDEWSRRGLGAWDVRDLVGHISRSLITVEEYLGGQLAGPPSCDAAGYYIAVAARMADSAAIEERGRAAGRALGPDPKRAISDLVARVTALVARQADDEPVASPAGPMLLIEYLQTRTFELVVHSLDLAAATARTPPSALTEPVRACVVLAARVAAQGADATDLLLALTGRRDLGRFSIV